MKRTDLPDWMSHWPMWAVLAMAVLRWLVMPFVGAIAGGLIALEVATTELLGVINLWFAERKANPRPLDRGSDSQDPTES